MICSKFGMLSLGLSCLVVTILIAAYIWIGVGQDLAETFPDIAAEQAQKRSPSKA